jgi:heme/copper-type cytochrome/quinol oxidase subunit 2
LFLQQLGEYGARYNLPSQVVRDSSLHIQAICDKELKRDYYAHASTRIFMACTAVIPIFVMAMLLIFTRSFRKEMNDMLARERNHGNFSAMLIIGICSQCVIVGMDMAAVIYVYTKQYEYKD